MTPKRKHWTTTLINLNACSEAVTFGLNYKTFKAAWDKCERGDWMLWYAGTLAGKPKSAKRKKLVLCACECARLALPYTKDLRVRTCIETAEAWARGKATLSDLQVARRAVSYAAAAADAAAYAYTAAYAAAYACAAAKRTKILKQCADIVRTHYPRVPR